MLHTNYLLILKRPKPVIRKLIKGTGLLIIPILIASCKDTTRPAATNKETRAVDTITAQTPPENKAWIDDFRDFRIAVYHDDMDALSRYFQFPVNDENGELWMLCEDANGDRAEPHHGAVTQNDLVKYHKRIFPSAFIKSILKVQSEQLYQSGSAETPDFTDEDRDYKMYATHDSKDQTLTLNLAFAGGEDEQGNKVSEGEYNIIYTFRIINGRQLQFQKINLAG